MSNPLISRVQRSMDDIVVELGMGDGKLIKLLSDKNPDLYYVGIEINTDLFNIARSSKKSNNNLLLINDSAESIVPLFEDNSVHKFISVLPDPKFIDKTRVKNWKFLYELIYKKLKIKGTFILITELTHELLQPVSDELFFTEVKWLKQEFASIGFNILDSFEGCQEIYDSSFLERFKGDPQRIRIVTFEFVKPKD